MITLRDGRKLHLRCTGEGGPTVVLDAGLGRDSSVWRKVQPELAKTTRTCAYDRAGYGTSDPGPLPRDANHLAADLLGMFDASGESGPFVVVAHSLSGNAARVAAKRRPDRIAGMVLVDHGAELDALKAAGPVWAAAFEQGRTAAMKCIRATASGEMRPGNPVYVTCGSPSVNGPLASRSMAQAVLSESESEPLGSVQAPARPGSLGDLPLIVLTAGKGFGTEEGAAPDETPRLREARSKGQASVAALSRRGLQRAVPESSHLTQVDRPEAVIAAVREVVAQVRARPIPSRSRRP